MDANKYNAQFSTSSEFVISDGRTPLYPSSPSCAGSSPPSSYLDSLSTKSGDGLLGLHDAESDDGLQSPCQLLPTAEFGKHGSASGPEYVTHGKTTAAGARKDRGCRCCVHSPLFWSIVVTVFCCSPVLGSTAICMAVKSRRSSESANAAKRARRVSIGLSVAAVILNLLVIGVLFALLYNRIDYGSSTYTIEGITYHFRFKPAVERSTSGGTCSNVCPHGLLHESYCYYDTRYTPGFCGNVPAADVYDGQPYRYYISSKSACQQAGKFFANRRCYPYVINRDWWTGGNRTEFSELCRQSSFGVLIGDDCFYFNRYDATNHSCSDSGPSYHRQSAVLFRRCCYYNDGIQY